MKLPPEYIAYKEASVPGIIGLAIIGSMKTKFPLVNKLLFNPALLNVDLIIEKLKAAKKELEFEKLLQKTSYLLSSSFFLSAILNFGLAKYLLVSEPGSEAFNEELGKMTLMSYPVIVVPSMIIMVFALYTMMNGIKKMTGLTVEDILHQPPAKTKK